MTTRVTVDAHAGWPVQVTPLGPDGQPNGYPVQTVPPGEIREFHVWDGQDLLIREMKKEA